MKIHKIHCFLAALFALSLIFSSCAPVEEGPQEPLYLAYNVWFVKPEALFAINYKVGEMIPAGTQIDRIRYGARRSAYVEFRVVEWGEIFRVNLQAKFHPGIRIGDVANRLITTKNFTELTGDLQPFEVEAIQGGKIIKGMSKEAVIISWGYPPGHKTPDLDSDRWFFWRNRFSSVPVKFDLEGKVLEDIHIY